MIRLSKCTYFFTVLVIRSQTFLPQEISDARFIKAAKKQKSMMLMVGKTGSEGV